jgi:hypothetical protein
MSISGVSKYKFELYFPPVGKKDTFRPKEMPTSRVLLLCFNVDVQ